MTEPGGAQAETVARLLDTLREATGSPGLEFRAPPTPLSGGFYAEMLRFRLADPPAELDRDLVARIVPSAAAGAWEAAVQRYVADLGFPTPAVRLCAPETSPLGRYLVVMDLVDGRPPMDGLSAGRVAVQMPTLLRHLPGQLAGMAASLHALDAEPLAIELDGLDSPFPATTSGFVRQLADDARSFDRLDVAAAGERLLAVEPPSSVRVVTHGDLHPFNLLITADGPMLIDWTVARVAHPGFTIGFTDLVLANPPVASPRGAAGVVGAAGRQLASRFRRAYRRLTDGTPAAVDDIQLGWHRRVHALRILVELASWEAAGERPAPGHPWLVMEPVARRLLDVGDR